MEDKSTKKDQPLEDQRELKKNTESSEEIAQEDQLTLDSDMEMEDLVESITEKERSMKK